MYYSMYDKKGRGDSGGMSYCISFDENNKATILDSPRPKIGCVMRVGSRFARTMQHQDWWQTTPIKEILAETTNEVVFKTRSGSIYTWKDHSK